MRRRRLMLPNFNALCEKLKTSFPMQSSKTEEMTSMVRVIMEQKDAARLFYTKFDLKMEVKAHMYPTCVELDLLHTYECSINFVRTCLTCKQRKDFPHDVRVSSVDIGNVGYLPLLCWLTKPGIRDECKKCLSSPIGCASLED